MLFLFWNRLWVERQDDVGPFTWSYLAAPWTSSWNSSQKKSRELRTSALGTCCRTVALLGTQRGSQRGIREVAVTIFHSRKGDEKSYRSTESPFWGDVYSKIMDAEENVWWTRVFLMFPVGIWKKAKGKLLMVGIKWLDRALINRHICYPALSAYEKT